MKKFLSIKHCKKLCCKISQVSKSPLSFLIKFKYLACWLSWAGKTSTETQLDSELPEKLMVISPTLKEEFPKHQPSFQVCWRMLSHFPMFYWLEFWFIPILKAPSLPLLRTCGVVARSTSPTLFYTRTTQSKFIIILWLKFQICTMMLSPIWFKKVLFAIVFHRLSPRGPDSLMFSDYNSWLPAMTKY